MNSLIEQAAIFLIKQLLTADMIKAGEKQLVEYLRKLAADSSNKVDDYMVDVIAEALGVA